MKDIGEYQKLFSPSGKDEVFNKLVHEESTDKQVACLQQLCQALVIDYARPSSMQAASKKINKLMQELKNQRSLEHTVNVLFDDVIADRTEELLYYDRSN